MTAGDVQAAIVFAGQGYLGLDELAELYREQEMVRKWVKAAQEDAEALLRERPFRWSALFRHGFRLDEWVREPASRPPLSYLSSTAVSQALIFVVQIARYQACFRDGLSDALAAGGIPILSGHSQGMMPALLVAESPAGMIRRERFLLYLRYFLWQGLHMAQSWSVEEGLEGASPMAAVSGIPLETLQTIIEEVNARLPDDRFLALSLFNTRTRGVVSGPPSSLENLRSTLEARARKENEARKAGRFGGSPLRFTWEYLAVGGPFHSGHMKKGYEAMLETVERIGFRVDARRLTFQVVSPATGELFNDSSDLTADLVRQQFIEPVRWRESLFSLIRQADVSYVLDMGPGDPVARLSASALRGSGCRVLALAVPRDYSRLFSPGQAPRERLPRYDDYAPLLVELGDGHIYVSNRYTRATGHHPVILPGMTPTTGDVEIVAAAANAGFTAELAGGSQVSENIFWLRMDELRNKLEPGREVVFNALFLDPYLWDLHLGRRGLVQEARRRGYPLCGVTISAGIPERDEAVRLLRDLHSLGMWLNAFKPGTLSQVDQVVQIARDVPEQTVFVHLEGGRAGGHHSWEDLDELLLGAYPRLRSVPNVVIAAGGGIGDEARALDLLRGTWSRRYGELPMPIDAVFVGTLAMATRESCASPQVKAALVKASGADAWVYSGDVRGGVTSGRSQLNADIHYLENAAARCGRLLDEVAGDREALQSRRREIISALNATAKPYFGDLESMTWLDVLERMIQLMAIGRGGRYEDGIWPDRSYRIRVLDMFRRAEARLMHSERPSPSVIDGPEALDAPEAVLARFKEAYPDAGRRRLNRTDIHYFIDEVCARPGKPVCFVPVIDANVRRWFKSDSLWQAHDERFSADQVLIIPGPQALKGIVRADEPVAELLGRFTDALVNALRDSNHLAQPVDRLLDKEPAHPEAAFFDIDRSPAHVEISVAKDGPASALHALIASTGKGALAELFLQPSVYMGHRVIPNPLMTLCHAGQGDQVVIELKKGSLYDLQYRPSGRNEWVYCRNDEEKGRIQVHVSMGSSGYEGAGDASLRLEFRVRIIDGQRRFVMEADERRDALRRFYFDTLFGRRLEPAGLFEEARGRACLGPEEVRAYLDLTSNTATPKEIPVNAVFALAWEPLFRVLSADQTADGLLNLVHLDNHLEAGPGWPIAVGEEIDVAARLVRMEDADSGRTIVTETRLSRGRTGESVGLMRSTFFVHGFYGETAHRVRARESFSASLVLEDQAAIDYFLGHSWIAIHAGIVLSPGEGIVLSGMIEEERPRHASARFSAKGVISRAGASIGTFQLDGMEGGGEEAHPVRALAAVLGGDDEARVAMPRVLLSRQNDRAPLSMDAFAEVGRDKNPIHRSVLMARLAGHRAPIVHGMWTAARLHGLVNAFSRRPEGARLRSFDVSFLAPVPLDAALRLELARVGMQAGDEWLEARAQADRGEAFQPVAHARVRVRPPKTAYVFPGQGIQRQGMGMEGFSRSAAARAVWNRADAFTRERLGFSILRVVRENPKELAADGALYRHPRGVLHLTQLTQVAMAVLAHAQVAELKEAGAFVPDAVTCGHSVGEYNALGAAADLLPFEDVIEIVYQRGLVMHHLVPRDDDGESGYRMGVIRPHYAGMTHDDAEALVREIRSRTGEFVQIVNYNIRGRQYSVTGRIAALQALRQALEARALPGGKPPYLEVPGIDVPFHSEILRSGVNSFRSQLRERLPDKIERERLVGRYIPNLTATPFSLERDWLRQVLELTRSPIMASILADYDPEGEVSDAQVRDILIELLAYQFASPVRWIETQDVLFRAEARGGLGIERVVEVGVGYQPTLANMARATLHAMPKSPGIEIMNVDADIARVLGRTGGIEPEAVEHIDGSAEEAASTAPRGGGARSERGRDGGPDASDEARRASPSPQAPGGERAVPEEAASDSRETRHGVNGASVSVPSSEPIPDRPLSVAEALDVLLAVQGRVRPEELDEQETLEMLLDGVSSRRNQALLDIGAEFGVGTLDGAHEKPLKALREELEKRAPGYRAAGPYLRALQDDAIKRMGARAGLSRKEISDYLRTHYGLGDGLIERVFNTFALETRDGSSGRGGTLGALGTEVPGDKSGVLALIDDAVGMVAQAIGEPIRPLNQGGRAEGATVDAAALQELESRLTGPKGVLMEMARSVARELGQPLIDEGPSLPRVDSRDERLALLEAEHGTDYEKGLAPIFDPLKHVAMTDAHFMAERDVAELVYDLLNKRITTEEAGGKVNRLRLFAGVERVRARVEWFRAEALRRGDDALASLLASMVDDRMPIHPWLRRTRPKLSMDDEGMYHYVEDVVEVQSPLEAFLRDLRSADPAPRFRFPGRDGVGATFMELLSSVEESPLSFRGRTALVTGAGPGSIALEVVRHLLAGGARVIVTTSSYSASRRALYRRVYEDCAGPGAELHVVPFNQSSFQDCDALLEWLYEPRREQVGAASVEVKPAFVPDLLLPFGAIKALGTLDQMSGREQLVLRAMLLSVERLIAGIARRAFAGFNAVRPCQVILPLSPNHGDFGGDGAYAESKAALEVLLRKWRSERDAWGGAVSLCAARIGWVRGTGLMDANDRVAEALEHGTGVRTFSVGEMGLMIAALSSSAIGDAARRAPLIADFTGGLDAVDSLKEEVDRIRADLEARAHLCRRRRVLEREEARLRGIPPDETPMIRPLPDLRMHFRDLDPFADRSAAWDTSSQAGEPEKAEESVDGQADGCFDASAENPRQKDSKGHNRKIYPHDDERARLDDTVVIVGAGEIGPWGGARTRFEIEVDGRLSPAGVLELAWMMGLVRYDREGRGGWVDVGSGERVEESDIGSRYEEAVMKASGIRFVEPEIAGFDPSALPVFTKVYLDRDFTFHVDSAEEARSFVMSDPEHTRAHLDSASGRWVVTRLAGTEVRVPRRVRASRRVQGLVPTGFDFRRFGLSQEMIDNVDRLSLFNIIATVDAFVSAGLSPQELLRWIHPSRVGNTQGAGIGGMRSLQRLYVDHVLDEDRHAEALQETLINVVAAYVVQSYVGSYGPMSHPVGACATAAVSIEEGVDKILVGKADFVVAGGFDDVGREGLIGFADMNATASTDAMLAMGMEPRAFSRANDRRRRGFVEAQGGGTILLARGDVALKMGLPVYGVVAYAGSFGDGIHKSIPAPGMGALAAACGGDASPLARALRRYALSVDDIALVYKHDTSTSANDPNENALHHRIQEALGRTQGNPLWVVSQKTVTGHPKGGAAAWQTLGLCQAMITGVVPGNRNLDCVDPAMEPHAHMAFTDRTLRPGPAVAMRAGLVTSLGFGHVSGLLLILHPDTFLALVPEAERSAYLEAIEAGLDEKADYWSAVLTGERVAFEKVVDRRFGVPDGSPEQAEREAAMLLDPGSRLIRDRDGFHYGAP